MEIVIAGFVLGLVTSFHCAGMCGPIAIALPLSGNSKSGKIVAGLVYHFGRTLTYVIAGLVFGLAGKGFNMLGFQQWTSIISGSLMILFALLPLLFSTSIESGLADVSFTRIIRQGFQKMFSKGTLLSLFVIGLLNGLLPCGPFYTALVAGTGFGSVFQSALFMLLFGLGTIPMLIVVTIAGNFLNQSIRRKAKYFLNILLVILGILFILRGANLGIPYLSPEKERINAVFESSKQDTVLTPKTHDCCSKK